MIGHLKSRAELSILGTISMLRIVFIMHNVAQTSELGETSPNNLEQDQQQNERDWAGLRMRTSSRLFKECVNI